MESVSHKISQIIRIVTVIGVIFVAKSSSNLIETKLENNTTNQAIDLSTMALKLEEDIKNDLRSLELLFGKEEFDIFGGSVEDKTKVNIIKKYIPRGNSRGGFFRITV